SAPEQRPLVELYRLQHQGSARKNNQEQPHEPIERIDGLKGPEQDLRGKVIAQRVGQPEARREQQAVLQLADLGPDLSVAAKHQAKLRGGAPIGPERRWPTGTGALPRQSVPTCGQIPPLPVRAGSTSNTRCTPSAGESPWSRGPGSSRACVGCDRPSTARRPQTRIRT